MGKGFFGKHTEETKRKISETKKAQHIVPKSVFKKGHTSWHKGKKGLVIAWNKGKTLSEEHRKHLSESHKGYKMPEEQKKKISESHKGKHIKEKNNAWLGGISFEPYGLEFDDNLREVIRNRDRRKCMLCGKTELENNIKLDIHHIDYNKKNNNPNNLISLCRKCHIKTNYGRDKWREYFNQIKLI